jgi:glycerophosphoryl diester phosphodiesterase
MAAFRAAAGAGSDGIELDIQRSSDGVPVICHDQNLRRITGLNRNIETLSLAELQRLDAGSWFSPRFAGEHIPTLEEALRLARREHLRVNAELKSTACCPHVERRVVRLIRKYHLERRCIIASQNYDALCRIKQYAPELTTLYVTDSVPDPADIPAADEISIRISAITAAAVIRYHACGKHVHLWTVDSPLEIRAAWLSGADNWITDNPGLIRRALSGG